jgi:hypothetical protein
MTGASHVAVVAALARSAACQDRTEAAGDRRVRKPGPFREADQVPDPEPPASLAMSARGSPPARTGQDKVLPHTGTRSVRKKRDEQILPDTEPGR